MTESHYDDRYNVEEDRSLTNGIAYVFIVFLLAVLARTSIHILSLKNDQDGLNPSVMASRGCGC